MFCFLLQNYFPSFFALYFFVSTDTFDASVRKPASHPLQNLMPMQVQALMHHVPLCTRLTPPIATVRQTTLHGCLQRMRDNGAFLSHYSDGCRQVIHRKMSTNSSMSETKHPHSSCDTTTWFFLFIFWHVSNTSSPKAACLICLPSTLPTGVFVLRAPAARHNGPRQITSSPGSRDGDCIKLTPNKLSARIWRSMHQHWGPAWHPFGQSGQVLFEQVSSAQLLCL